MNLTRRMSALALSICLTVAAASAAQASVVREDGSLEVGTVDLPTYRWYDDQVSHKAVIVAIHGVTLHGARYDHLARHLAQQGYVFSSFDLRGYGKWREMAGYVSPEAAAQYEAQAIPQYEKRPEIFTGKNRAKLGASVSVERQGGSQEDATIDYIQSRKDLVAFVEKIRQDYPKQKIYCLGESLGANLGVWLAVNHPDLVDGLILSSPCVKRVLHAQPRQVYDATRELFHPHKTVSVEPYITPFLSEDERVTKDYCDDPLIRMDISAYDLIASFLTNRDTLKGAELMPQTLPVLVISGKLDHIYKAAATPKLVARMGSKNKTFYLAEDRGHLLLEHHFIAPNILETIDHWLAGEVAQGGPLVDASSNTRQD